MKFGFLTVSLFLLSLSVGAQKPGAASRAQPAAVNAVNPVKASAAYADVILRRTELEADLESMLLDYTDEHPKVKQARLELALIQRELDRLLAVKPEDAGKLSEALGKLMVRKTAFEVDLELLRDKTDDKNPNVISAQKKVDVFEKAIKDILGQ
jgi:hypothetical protein